ncbi:MAG: BrnT family toxin [Pseudomonadota bacterium]
MKFEYDPEKSASNHDKHGIDFEDAQALWLDPDLLEIQAKTIDEPRYMVIGKINDTHWSAIITYRDDYIRLISVRRSREAEVKIYEST